MFRLQIDDSTELRLLEARHAPELFALTDACREHLREWLPWVDGNTELEHTQGFIRGALEGFAAGKRLESGIWCEGQLAGTIGGFDISEANRSMEIGYWLAPTFLSRGLMTRACRALVDHAFADRRLNRVQIRCATQNHKSRAIPERLGFAQEGVLREVHRLNGRFVDLVVYAMLARDWPGTGPDGSDR